MSTYVTVPGAPSPFIVNPYNTPYNLQVANQIASILAVAQSNGTLFVQNYAPAPPIPSLPSVPAGDIGELAVTGASGYIQVPSGYTFTAIGPTVQGGSSVTGPFTVSGGGSLFVGNQNVTYFGQAAAGTVLIAAGDGNSLFALPGGTTYDVAMGNGSDTVYGNGSGTITGGSGNNLIFADSAGGSNIVNSFGGHDTIVAGAGNVTINSGGVDPRIWGGSNNLVFIGTTAGNPTISGPTGSGHETLFGGAGQNMTYQDGSGTVPGSAILAAGTGNETLNAGGSKYGAQLAAGLGTVSMTGSSGNDVFYGGSGVATMTGNGGSDLFQFASASEPGGQHGGLNIVTDFNSSDTFNTVGYGANAAQNALGAATVSGGNLTVKLSDGTTVEFLGVSSTSTFQHVNSY